MKDAHPVQNRSSGIAASADFIAFMRSYQDMVFTTAARMLADDAQAEDIAQEVFLKAHDHFEMLAASPTAGGWLKTVTTRLCINHLQRYRNRWRFFSEFHRVDDEGDKEDFDCPAPEALFSGIDASERRQSVENALSRLPGHQRVPLVLFHFDDLSYQEIAARLGISLAKVKTDIFRARVALARLLAP
jgi:RNA polymerase sigma-70 factor (ECF subfamily)